MPIEVRCESCGRLIRAPDRLAGKRCRCPKCQGVVGIPAAWTESEYTLAPLDPALEATPVPVEPIQRPAITPPPPKPATPPLLATPPEHVGLTPRRSPAGPSPPQPGSTKLPPGMTWKQWLAIRRRDAIRRAGQPRFFFFAATLIPLALTLLFDPSATRRRLERTLEAHPEVAEELERAGSLDAALELLPERRIEGALLPRNSMAHWLYALAAALLFFSLILLLFDPGNALLPHWLGAGLLTSTIGVLLLVSLQMAAELGRLLPGSGSWYQLLRLIGFSYHAALDPENGFVLSLLGFTFGVGLCEELTKALPLLLRLRSARPLDWRGACVWGLASGVGFGVAEGVMYSGDFYNGIAGAEMYVVRFVSCVALHAIWAAAMGIMLARLRSRLGQKPDWVAWAIGIVSVFAAPVVLHGLYDTLLKRELNGAALVVAALSFAWLACLTHLCVSDERRAHEALLRGVT